VLVLIGIGLAAGLITAISPCVLPVLPILLAGGATGTSTRRPLAIVAGLVASFTVFTLLASRLLHALGLPQDLLRNIAITLLFVLAATLLFPALARLAERPFLFLTRRSGNDLGGGFLLGASLGLVFVPCAGPVLAAITVVAANQAIGARAIVLTLSYAVGAALPMLAIALGGQRVARRLRAPVLRPAMGIVVAATALAIALGADTRFQTALPGYTEALQKSIERSSAAKKQLAAVTRAHATPVKAEATGLPDFGPAPAFAGISSWINSRPLDLAQLRGKVVLVDFWTYSCINCLRTLPHLKAWYARYARDGLVIVGVHTPEFAFEHVLSNVRAATKRYGVRYPVALDNGYGTWNAYANQYWPAEYLIDAHGHVRHTQFGEGDYKQSEAAVRQLLYEAGARTLPAPMTAAAVTPSAQLATPETYLNTQRAQGFAQPLLPGVHFYHGVQNPILNEFGLQGTWKVSSESATPVSAGSSIEARFQAADVYLVMTSAGNLPRQLGVLLDGHAIGAHEAGADVHGGAVTVRGQRLYSLVSLPTAEQRAVTIEVPPGVSAYDFTFG
jgi:cytochrome c biogenesis protein CcdA/thiol-disulfide isomerase/thioredoxin